MNIRSSSLQVLLEAAVKSNLSQGLLISIYGDTKSFTKVTYTELLNQAPKYSRILQYIAGFQPAKPIILYFQDYSDTFIWFQAALFTDIIPVLILPFSDIAEQQQSHIGGLTDPFEHFIYIILRKMLYLFDSQGKLNIYTTESLSSSGQDASVPPNTRLQGYEHDNLAMLILTSGSTEAPKAVRLSHNQICSAVAIKVSIRDILEGKPFLNWISLDHMASITEIYLTVMYFGVDQIYLYISDIIA